MSMWIINAVFILAQVAPVAPSAQPQPLPSMSGAPSAVVTSTPSPSAALPTAPVAVPTPAPPTAAPTAAPPTIAPPTATPSALATQSPYGFVYVVPPAIPPSKIIEIDMTDRVLRSHAGVHVRVLTSPDVVSVSALAMGREFDIPRVDRGDFEAVGTVPGIPFFMQSTFDVAFVARTADGQTTTVTLPIEVR